MADDTKQQEIPSLPGRYAVSQSGSEYARALSEEERAKLESDTNLVTEFKQLKLEKEAQKNWDLFYKRNTTKFFKDRHWTTREFSDLCGREDSSAKLVLLEVGCGVGNFIFPLIEDDPNLFVYACDFSPRAVQFVKENALYGSGQCTAFQCDLTRDDLCLNVPPESVDIVTMIFVLSAIHPEKMVAALSNILKVMKPGGCVLFRDYGLYDHAQLRFSSGHKLQDNFYVRQDGTRAYYFAKGYLESLFVEAGFRVEDNEYVLRQTVNKKENLCVPRVFLQGKFTKCETGDIAGRDSTCTNGTSRTTPEGDSTQTMDQKHRTEATDTTDLKVTDPQSELLTATQSDDNKYS